jgi:hypothetical protein
MRPHVDGLRLAMFERLLARADERALRGKRGHRVTQRGKRDRFIKAWLWSMRVWSEHEIARRAGAHDGWMPAHRSPSVASASAGHGRLSSVGIRRVP